MMEGEDGTEYTHIPEDSFAAKSVWTRISVVAAGPIFRSQGTVTMLAFSYIHSYASPNLSFVVFISLVGILLLMFSGILTIHVSRDHIHVSRNILEE